MADRAKIVVVIDDAEESLLVTEAVLAGAGFHVVVVSHADNLFGVIFDKRPDLILCDVRMPGLDGPALMNMLRRVNLGRRIPILMYSGLTEEKLAESAKRCGAEGYVTKSSSDDLLLARVREALGMVA